MMSIFTQEYIFPVSLLMGGTLQKTTKVILFYIPVNNWVSYCVRFTMGQGMLVTRPILLLSVCVSMCACLCVFVFVCVCVYACLYVLARCVNSPSPWDSIVNVDRGGREGLGWWNTGTRSPWWNCCSVHSMVMALLRYSASFCWFYFFIVTFSIK